MMKNIFIFENERDYSVNKLDLSYFRKTYTHIRSYHACKPLRIETYYINGIKPITKAYAKRLLKSISSNFKNETVSVVFEKEWQEHDSMHKKVWLCIDKDELLHDSTQYLIYGSEFILSIAVKLGLKYELQKIGIPTLFHCDIEVNKISEYYLRGLIESINHSCGSFSGFAIEGFVDSSEIFYHEHPTRIFDVYDKCFIEF